MKRIISLLLVAAMLFSMTACTLRQQPDNKQSTKAPNYDHYKARIGLSIAGMTMPYFVSVYEAFLKAAKEKNYEVIFADGGSDAETCIKSVEDLIANNIDALAVGSVHDEALIDAFEHAQKRKIPIFYIGRVDLMPEVKKYVTFYEGTSHEAPGHLGGEWVAKYLDSKNYKKELNVVEVSWVEDNLHKRYLGFVKGLEENGYKVNYINTVGDLTRENSMTGCEDMLTAHDNIDIFYGTAGTSALGAYDATKNANRTEVMVVGYDGTDEEKTHIDEGSNYIATICQQPELEAKITVDAIETVLNGGKVQGGQEVPAIIYGAGVGFVK